LFRYRIDAERLPITTTLAADVALAAAAAAALQTHRRLFVLTPQAPCNFNKSLSKTSTFALGLQRVSRGDSSRIGRLCVCVCVCVCDERCCCYCGGFSGWRCAVTKLF